MSKGTHIYALHDPRDWAIRYVGKANDPERRRRAHEKRPVGAQMRAFVRELRSLGLSLRVSVLSRCSQEDWSYWEKFWIETCRKAGERLLNIAPGGNAPPAIRTPEHNAAIGLAQLGRIVSAETRKKIGDANRGRIHSVEARKRMGNSKRGKLHSADHRAKIGASQVGRKVSLETRLKISAAMRKI